MKDQELMAYIRKKAIRPGEFGEEDLCELLDMGSERVEVPQQWSSEELGMRLEEKK